MDTQNETFATCKTALKQLLSPQDLANILNVKVKTIYYMNSQNPKALPKPVHIGRLVRWRPEDVEAYLNSLPARHDKRTAKSSLPNDNSTISNPEKLPNAYAKNATQFANADLHHNVNIPPCKVNIPTPDISCACAAITRNESASGNSHEITPNSEMIAEA